MGTSRGVTGRETGTRWTTVEPKSVRRGGGKKDSRPRGARALASVPDDAALTPEHPGNVPAGTPANPVAWGDAYERDDEQ